MKSNRRAGKWNWFLTVATAGLLLISAVHYAFLVHDCAWWTEGCEFAINDAAHSLYESFLLHGPIWFGALVFMWMLYLQKIGEEYRVQYAIGGFLLIGISVGYVSAYNWDWAKWIGDIQHYDKKYSPCCYSNIGFNLHSMATSYSRQASPGGRNAGPIDNSTGQNGQGKVVNRSLPRSISNAIE